MNEFDDITDEERLLATKLAAHLEEADPPEELPQDVAAPLSLLTNIARFELAPEARARGRAEIEHRVAASTKGLSKPEDDAAPPKWRFLYWLPLPTLAVLVLVFATSGPTERHETLKHAESESGFSPLPPRYHIGETPRALLSAQAAVLASRAPGQERERARDEFERQMRVYRGQLIASLEVGGR